MSKGLCKATAKSEASWELRIHNNGRDKGKCVMWKQIQWLWENMEPKYRRRHISALCICVFSCFLLLVNPALSRRLIDEVIIAQNPEPLLGILFIMLAVKLGREGMRYLMVILMETAGQSVIFRLRKTLFRKM